MRDLLHETYALRTRPAIDPGRTHGFRPTMDGRCAACSWREGHQLHKLRGRPFPYNGATVRLLSHPSRDTRPHFPRGVLVGAEGVVTSGSNWYQTVYGSACNRRADHMFRVYFPDAEKIAWASAGTLLVLPS